MINDNSLLERAGAADVKRVASADEALESAIDKVHGLAATELGGALPRTEANTADIESVHVSKVLFPQATRRGSKVSCIDRKLGPRGFNTYRGLKRVSVPDSGASHRGQGDSS